MKQVRASSIELPALAGQRMAAYLGIQFPVQDANSDQSAVTTLLDAIQQQSRALWAVRVLDAWAKEYDGTWQYYIEKDGCHYLLVQARGSHPLGFEHSRDFEAGDADAARRAAAEAVIAELPADVRQALGEKP